MLQVQAVEVVGRSATRTPDIASNAAEVADSAMILDREIPTPPILDEEAGRIGFRRMSQTPIPEVAETAAEVADSAAILDDDNMVCGSLRPIWLLVASDDLPAQQWTVELRLGRASLSRHKHLEWNLQESMY